MADPRTPSEKPTITVDEDTLARIFCLFTRFDIFDGNAPSSWWEVEAAWKARCAPAVQRAYVEEARFFMHLLTQPNEGRDGG